MYTVIYNTFTVINWLCTSVRFSCLLICLIYNWTLDLKFQYLGYYWYVEVIQNTQKHCFIILYYLNNKNIGYIEGEGGVSVHLSFEIAMYRSLCVIVLSIECLSCSVLPWWISPTVFETFHAWLCQEPAK